MACRGGWSPFERRSDGVPVGVEIFAMAMAYRSDSRSTRVIQTQVKGVAAHMKQARAWTSVEVTERLAAQPPPPPRVARVPLREASMAWGTRRVDGVGGRRRAGTGRDASMA